LAISGFNNRIKHAYLVIMSQLIFTAN